MSSLSHSYPKGSYWLNETPDGFPDLAEFSRTRDFGLETWFGSDSSNLPSLCPTLHGPFQ